MSSSPTDRACISFDIGVEVRCTRTCTYVRTVRRHCSYFSPKGTKKQTKSSLQIISLPSQRQQQPRPRTAELSSLEADFI